MKTDISYLATPFFAWLLGGCLKFIINSIKLDKPAFKQIGYGGLPSNHAGIASSIVFLVALKEGINNPAFGIAIAFAFIVVLDASSLRRQIGKHAEIINALSPQEKHLRERIGHTPLEILAGFVVGLFSALTINLFFSPSEIL